MAKNIKRFSLIFITSSVVISVLIFFYYTQIIAPDTSARLGRLMGKSAYIASLVISISIVYFALLLWQSKSNLGDVLRPTYKKVGWAIVVSLMTPVLNFDIVPMPSGLGVLLNLGFLFRGDLVFAFLPHTLIPVIPAYLITCLSQSRNTSFGKVILRIALYFFGVFAAVTLFVGITSI